MDKKTLNLGLNSGLPKSDGLTWPEALALIDENQRRGGRTVTRKSQTERYAERAAKGKQPPGSE